MLPYARRKLDPLIDWALRHRVLSICCDSIRADFEATVAILRLLIDMTGGTQLRVGVENSQRGIINSADKMNEAVERVDDERMGLLVDVGHINTTITNGWIACDDPAEFLDGLRVPIWDTHIHNNDGRTDSHLTVRDPAGTLDMVTIVESLHRLGYKGPLNMECAPKEERPSRTALAPGRADLSGRVCMTWRGDVGSGRAVLDEISAVPVGSLSSTLLEESYPLARLLRSALRRVDGGSET